MRSKVKSFSCEWLLVGDIRRPRFGNACRRWMFNTAFKLASLRCGRRFDATAKGFFGRSGQQVKRRRKHSVALGLSRQCLRYFVQFREAHFKPFFRTRVCRLKVSTFAFEIALYDLFGSFGCSRRINVKNKITVWVTQQV